MKLHEIMQIIYKHKSDNFGRCGSGGFILLGLDDYYELRQDVASSCMVATAPTEIKSPMCIGNYTVVPSGEKGAVALSYGQVNDLLLVAPEQLLEEQLRLRKRVREVEK